MSPRYVVRRLLLAAGVVAAILTLSFALVHMAPGGSVQAMAGDGASRAQLDAMTARFGLDRPLPEQFASYTSHVLRGDLGNSYVYNRPVSGLIGERLRATLLLTGSALILSTIAGIGLGMVASRRPFRAVDLSVNTASVILYALPAFWSAQLAVMFFAVRTRWFPVEGMTDARTRLVGASHVLDVAHHLVLPALVLAASEVALLTRVTRGGLIQEGGRDYMRTARAKGQAESVIMTRHALPNALLPILTVIGGRIGYLFAGAVIVETVFAWPGLGSLLVGAAVSRDYPVVLGMLLLTAFSVVLVHVVTDLVLACVDPRVRLR